MSYIKTLNSSAFYFCSALLLPRFRSAAPQHILLTQSGEVVQMLGFNLAADWGFHGATVGVRNGARADRDASVSDRCCAATQMLIFF